MKFDRSLTIDDLPIPADARVTKKWTTQMLEMAAHIGAYRTLLVIDALGGQQIYIPVDPTNSPMVDVIGKDGAAIMSRIYGPARLWVPVGRAALNEARRATVIAACRSRTMMISEGAMILKTSRSYLGHLVNSTVEGPEAEPYVPRLSRHDPRQIELFPDHEASE